MKALLDYMALTDLSQVDLAKKIGVSQGQLNHWVKRRRRPSVLNLKRISEKTGISLERLARDL